MNWPKSLPKLPIHFFHHPSGLFEGWFIKGLLLLLIGWLTLGSLAPQKPVLPDALRGQVDEQLDGAVNDLAEKASRMKIGRLAVLHLAGDDSDYATQALRRRLHEKGVGQQPPPPFGERARALVRMRQPSYGEAEMALKEGKSRGVDAAVFGRLKIEGTRATLDLRLADTRNGADVAVRTEPPAPTTPPETAPVIFTGGEGGTGGGPAGRSFNPPAGGALGLGRALVATILVVLLLPVFTIGFLRDTVRRRSNARNAFTLSVYTAADLLTAWLALSGHSVGLMLTMIPVITLLGFLYNVAVMSWAVRYHDDLGTAGA